MDDQEIKRSVYHSGATDGLYMGACFCVIFLLSAYGSKVDSGLLSLISLFGMFVAVPVLLYYFMRRRYVEERHGSYFSTTWMHGITAIICGNLILGLIIYVFLKFVDPTYIADQASKLAETYASMGTPTTDELSEALDSLIASHLLPSPISVAISTMWFGCFLGTLLSLIETVIVRFTKKQ